MLSDFPGLACSRSGKQGRTVPRVAAGQTKGRHVSAPLRRSDEQKRAGLVQVPEKECSGRRQKNTAFSGRPVLADDFAPPSCQKFGWYSFCLGC